MKYLTRSGVPEVIVGDRTIDVHIRKIRQKAWNLIV
jgi:DNA-binding response OmpR family regulator